MDVAIQTLQIKIFSKIETFLNSEKRKYTVRFIFSIPKRNVMKHNRLPIYSRLPENKQKNMILAVNLFYLMHFWKRLRASP